MSWFGHPAEALARLLGVPRVAALARVGSTMDAAHALAAEGAPAGTLVVAEEQGAGRGRSGRAWASAPRSGIWLTLVERPRAADAIDVLSLRVGLHVAPVLERWTGAPIRLKWPNDLFVDGRKLAGVLIEARWRGGLLDWVAIGLGVNLRPPTGVPDAAALRPGTDPAEVLAELVPALRAAAFATGPLREEERAAFDRRDLARGQALSAPALGTARGISAAGELLVETADGLTPCRAGSLVLANP